MAISIHPCHLDLPKKARYLKLDDGVARRVSETERPVRCNRHRRKGFENDAKPDFVEADFGEEVEMLPRKGPTCPAGAYLSDHYISAVAKTQLELLIRTSWRCRC